jgi:hypothetical protein
MGSAVCFGWGARLGRMEAWVLQMGSAVCWGGAQGWGAWKFGSCRWEVLCAGLGVGRRVRVGAHGHLGRKLDAGKHQEGPAPLTQEGSSRMACTAAPLCVLKGRGLGPFKVDIRGSWRIDFGMCRRFDGHMGLVTGPFSCAGAHGEGCRQALAGVHFKLSAASGESCCSTLHNVQLLILH